MYKQTCAKIQNIIAHSGFKLRPEARSGIWLFFLVPLSIIASSLKYPQQSFHLYKTYSIFSIGLLATSVLFLYRSLRKNKLETSGAIYFIPAGLSAILFKTVADGGVLFSVCSGIFSSVVYQKLFLFFLNVFPLSLTIGEAAVVTQGISIFLYAAAIKIYKSPLVDPLRKSDITTIIIQVGLIGIGLICLLTFLIRGLRKSVPFYLIFAFGVLAFILFPLHVIIDGSPLLWILQLLSEDLTSIALILHWILCCFLTVFAINNQIANGKKATTAVRKIFHLLAIAIYVPGLLYKCTLLYFASGIVLGIFLAIELFRAIKLPPIAEYLQNGFSVYCDDKDAGIVAFTPIYLLSGMSLPIWIHPAPCDVTDSARFCLLPLLSGVLTIGIGDTAASVIGSKFGKHHWPGSKKTFEGTLACIVSQLTFVFALLFCGFINYNFIALAKTAFAVILTSFIEAKTSQVDNLVLPLVMYIILV